MAFHLGAPLETKIDLPNISVLRLLGSKTIRIYWENDRRKAFASALSRESAESASTLIPRKGAATRAVSLAHRITQPRTYSNGTDFELPFPES